MFEYIDDAYFLVGPRGRLPVSEHDEITRRLAMLYEGQCEEALITETARKFGYPISASSVKRVIAQFGLQKKTPSMSTRQRSH